MAMQPLTERRHSWNAGLREQFKQLEDRWNRLHPPLAFGDSGTDGAAAAAADGEMLSNFGLSPEMLKLFDVHRPNVLLVGPDSNVLRVLDALTPLVEAPIMSCEAGRLALPQRPVGTLVLHAADHLSGEEQQELFGWMSAAPGRSQVITTASVPLFPLVMRKRFSDALFYRLNEMCVIVR
jgi:hypothetical protein